MKKITIPLVATAAVKLENVPYTGTNGLYASLLPQYTGGIVEIAEELGIKLDPNVVHTTVCYSKTPVAIDNLPAIGSSNEFRALCNQVDHWVGHKKQTCIVLKLVSPDIVDVNANLQRRGAVHTFTPYVPHITLTDESAPVDGAMQERIDAINKRLAQNPIWLTFDRYTIGDLK